MSEPTAQRTLVKSPPELWAEVSDPQTLARHLGEFGVVRITRLEPETTVVWEGDRASGTVNLEPSGWGTKVTLTAELAALEQALAEPEVEEPIEAVIAEPAPTVEQPAAKAPTEEPAIEERAAPAPPVDEPVGATSPPPPRRRGFLARLFGSGASANTTAIPEHQWPVAIIEPPSAAPVVEVAEPTVEPANVVVQPTAVVVDEPIVVDPTGAIDDEEQTHAADRAADPAPAPATDRLEPERAAEVLASVLDKLGAAHHRPFSRG